MMKNLYALLVGITDYPAPVPKLAGCVNDIDAIEDYLNNRIDTDQYQLNIQRLSTNGRDILPTRKAVIAGFQNHLYQAKEGDVVLFYFSGHGSQEPASQDFDGLEPDRMNETLVCLDSRTEDWDLADKELAYLIHKISQQNPHHIVIILDSCHSGSGTRDTFPKQGVRQSPADRRIRSINQGDYIFSRTEWDTFRGSTTPPTPEEGDPNFLKNNSGWTLPYGRHVLLSACEDRQLATENNIDGQQRGAFSYFLLDTLTKANGQLSYRELFKRTRSLVRTRIKDQTPQLEATNIQDVDNLSFLGDPRAIKNKPLIFTLTQERNKWVIDGGAVHGIPINQEIIISLFTPGSQAVSVSKAGEQPTITVGDVQVPKLGEAKIVKVLAYQSIVEFIEGEEPKDLTPDTVLNAVISYLPIPALSVYLEAGSESADRQAVDAIRQAIQTANDGRPSLYIRVVDNPEEAQYRLLAKNQQLIIAKPFDEKPLIEQLINYSDLNFRKAVQNLEHISRWTTVAELSNPDSKLPPNCVALRVFHNGKEILEPSLRLEYEQEKGEWVTPTFRIKLTNNYNKRLYCALYDLPEDYAVTVLNPAPQRRTALGGVWIEPGQTEDVSVEVGDETFSEISASIPEILLQQGVTEYQDLLKLVVSTGEFDSSLLTQEELPPPQQELRSKNVITRDIRSDIPNSTLNQLMTRIQYRHLAAPSTTKVDDWVTSEITINTVHPQDAQSIKRDTITNIGAGVSITQNPGLVGNARLSTPPQATRNLGTQLLPSLLRDFSEPFQFTASKGVDPGLSILELQINDNASLNAVTSGTPLVLSVDKPLSQGEYVLPVAYEAGENGESGFFVPLGLGVADGNKTQIRIEQLPDPVTEKKKSLGGSIRILFQKVVYKELGLSLPYPKLRIARFVADEADEAFVYEEGIPEVKKAIAALPTGSKVVLYIHGIIGDTESMVPSMRRAKVEVNGELKPLTELYDLVLTFDYENLNTSIKELGEQLKNRLAEVGLGPNHGKVLHIVAHSMGGLVSRSFIEQWGGNQVVQHLIMLGTPNAGSPWSTVADWALYMLTFGLNNLSAAPIPIKMVSSILHWLNPIGKAAELVKQMNVNLAEMHPARSTFLPDLNKTQPPLSPALPYTIIAGNTSLVQQEAANRLMEFLNKAKRSVIGFPFLKQENDIAVLVTSIRAVPANRSSKITEQVIACDHLSYFTHPEGLKALSQAIANALGISGQTPSSSIPGAASPAAQPSTPVVRPTTESNLNFVPANSASPNWLWQLLGAVGLIGAILGLLLWQPWKSKPNQAQPAQSQIPVQSVLGNFPARLEAHQMSLKIMMIRTFGDT
jgi:pimeloyl-ACP methyl ester carboxylesterase